MSEIEIITIGGRRRRWSAAEKLRSVEATLNGWEGISVVAQHVSVARNLLCRWRRPMLEGASVAVTRDGEVTCNRAVRRMEVRIREFERQLGRKTLEVEIPEEALDRPQERSPTLLIRSSLKDDSPPPQGIFRPKYPRRRRDTSPEGMPAPQARPHRTGGAAPRRRTEPPTGKTKAPGRGRAPSCHWLLEDPSDQPMMALSVADGRIATAVFAASVW
jgi:transposase